MVCRGPIGTASWRHGAHRTPDRWRIRHLGPALEAHQVLLTIDEVLERQARSRALSSLRTARIMSEHGSGYLSGMGIAFLQRLQLALLLGLGPLSSLLVLASRARSLRSFFSDSLTRVANKRMLLDWHHLKQKCLELSSLLCRGKTAKAQLLRRL
jgi:hypothetical protein